MRKRKSKFLPALLLFFFVCAILGIVFLIYVHHIVTNYDKVQPERVVESEIERLSRAAEDGSLIKELDFRKRYDNRYEKNDISGIETSYAEKFIGKELSYRIIAEECGELTKTYFLLSDGKNIGKLTLSGENPRTDLFFFSAADWSVSGFEPIPTDTVYNLKLYCPDEVTVYINGKSPEPSEADHSSETPLYIISGLLSAPEIEYVRADGTSVPYSAENNIIKPALYNYRFELPEGIAVSVNGTQLTGTPSGGLLLYDIKEMEKPETVLTDKFGGKLVYAGESEIPFYSYTAAVPTEYSVTVLGKNVEDIITPDTSPHPDAEQLYKLTGIKLPELKRYTISLLQPADSATVYDGTGSSREYSLSGGNIEITSLTAGGGVPDNISAETDVLEAAKTWSKFMTDDLGGASHGLAKVKELFIEGSDYDRSAEEWATGIDITFTSVHTLDGFSNERVEDYISYGDNCFSCKVYFEKNMTLYASGAFVGTRTDVFNSIMYFVKIEDGTWRIALMHDNL